MQRVGLLQIQIKEQNEEHIYDNQHLMEIIGKSEEICKHLFDKDRSTRCTSECPESAESFAENNNFSVFN